MLKDPEYQGRACAALPALCEIETLRKKLLKEDLVSRIVELCRKAGENKLIALRTLSYLAQRFDETSDILSRQSDFINDILVMLKAKSTIVVVAALKILAAVASKGNIPEDTRGIELVKRLKTLIKRRDFFVTPAAVAALCEICQNEKLRAEAIRRDILVTLIDLFEFDKQGLSGGPRGLMKLAEHGDVRAELARGPHIGKLVAFSRDKVVEKSNEATEELTRLSKYDELRKRIIDKGGLDSIVDNLAKPDHALFAADAVLTLMQYDDAKERILDTEVDLRLLQMIEGRIFDGTIHREGIDILVEIFKNDDLRSMMLKPKNPPSLHNGSWNFDGKDASKQLLKKAANYVLKKAMLVKKLAMDDSDKPGHPGNILGILRKMIETTRFDSVQNSAINYLRIIADHEDARQTMSGVGIIEPLLFCLKIPDVDIRALNDVLKKIARHELLRGEIMENDKVLAEMLSSHYPVEILRMTATLESLSSHRDIRQKVQEMGEYQNLKKDALHYLDPHHHPHEHDLYTSASQAIKSIIAAFDTYDRTTHQSDSDSYLDPYDYPEEIYQYMI
ncbi:ARM repeat-containing protein [Suillus weaverae]|nr:ARM repeat-containing protein [Suillus weaverae]